MSSQQSNERRPNRPLSHIVLNARQMLRVNTLRAANWFRKPSFPQFKLKSCFILSRRRSHSSPYMHPSLRDDDALTIQSSSTTLLSFPIRAPQTTSTSTTLLSFPTRAPQTTSTYNSRTIRQVRTTSIIVPIMPTVRLLFVHWLSSRLTIMHHVSSLVLDLVPIYYRSNCADFIHGFHPWALYTTVLVLESQVLRENLFWITVYNLSTHTLSLRSFLYPTLFFFLTKATTNDIYNSSISAPSTPRHCPQCSICP